MLSVRPVFFAQMPQTAKAASPPLTAMMQLLQTILIVGDREIPWFRGF
jgi:hypothetical protein